VGFDEGCVDGWADGCVDGLDEGCVQFRVKVRFGLGFKLQLGLDSG
jgi:hypothetical protein